MWFILVRLASCDGKVPVNWLSLKLLQATGGRRTQTNKFHKWDDAKIKIIQATSLIVYISGQKSSKRTNTKFAIFLKEAVMIQGWESPGWQQSHISQAASLCVCSTNSHAMDKEHTLQHSSQHATARMGGATINRYPFHQNQAGSNHYTIDATSVHHHQQQCKGNSYDQNH